jgi:predicted nucleic acid-binding protein
VSLVIVLDWTPLGALANPRMTNRTRAAYAWLAALPAAGHTFIVPEIADYEVRRELLRLGQAQSIVRLDWLTTTLHYLPLTTPAMRLAAELWATARRTGQPTAANAALDGDVILAAQTLGLADPTAVIATGNPGHLSRCAPAADWQTIVP